jgi:hypothetical protein
LPIANFASGASDFLSDYGAASVGGILSQITPAGGAVLPLIKRLALLGPDLPGYALVGSHGRFLVPVALIGGLGTIALGLMLMTSGFVSRRKLLRTSSAGANGEPDSDPGVAR